MIDSGIENPLTYPADQDPWFQIIQEAFLLGKEPQSWPEPGLTGAGWQGLAKDIIAVRTFMLDLTKGDLSAETKVKGQLAGSIKAFQGNLRHLAWQVQQVAAGDLTQKVEFMGDFSNAFNQMISNLKNAQYELQSSEARYRLLAENAADVIWTIDLQGHFTYITPSIERLRGFTVDEAMRQTIDESLAPASAAYFKGLMVQMQTKLANSEKIDGGIFELEQTRKDGSTVWIEVTTSGLFDPKGEWVGIQGASRDITERRRAQEAEREQRRMAEALRDSAAALNSAMGLDDVLNVLLSQIEQVVPHDTMEILLIDTHGIARAAATKGFEVSSPGHDKHVFQINLPVMQIPNLAQMASTGKPLLIDDLRKFSWIRMESSLWANSHLGAPILIKGKAVGFIILLGAKTGFFEAKYLEHLQIFANQAAVAIEKARLFEQLNELATIDSLTDISNRRHFFNLAENELTRSIRYQHPLSALMMDIDHFKQVNDTYGHSNGDQVLHALAQRCLKTLRTNDLIGRYGGEEFSFILPETPIEEAVSVAERLRETISKKPFTIQTGDIHITVSIGVAGFRSQIPSARALLDLADQALYQAKQAGRNRVVKA